jgi:hypothetical protein
MTTDFLFGLAKNRWLSPRFIRDDVLDLSSVRQTCAGGDHCGSTIDRRESADRAVLVP